MATDGSNVPDSSMDNATATISSTGDAVRIQIASSPLEQVPEGYVKTTEATASSSSIASTSSDPQILSPPTIDILPMASGFSRFWHLLRHDCFDPIAQNFTNVTEVGSLNLHQHKFNNRELTFLTVVFMLAVTGIGLIISVAVDRSTVFVKFVAPEESSGNVCLDYNCFKSSALMQRSMNLSVSPCNNFYQYACGGWIAAQAMTADEQERTVLTTIMEQNIHRLKDVLLSDLDQYRDTSWAYEKKVTTYYKACIDQFQSTLVSIIANPVVDEIHKMGGWYVFDGSVSNGFNRTQVLAGVLGHDNLVDVFFFYDIEPLDQQHQHHFITIREDWMLPLPYYLWQRSEIVKAYRQFVRKVGELISRDGADYITNDVAQLSKRLDMFVDDVTEIERALANIQRTNEIEIVNPRSTIRTIAQLQQDIAPAFRWLYYFQVVLIEADAAVLNSKTQVVIRTPRILKAVSDFLLGGGTSMRRKVHNYLVWRLVYSQLPELPYRYNHLWLDWSEKVRGRAFQYEPIWSVCFQRVVNQMSDAVGGLFTRKHFTHYDKAELRLMVESTRLAVMTEVQSLPWMDETTKGNATEKLYHLKEKMGFPDHMDSELNMQNALDFLYKDVEFVDDDHFANAQQLRQHLRKQLTQFFMDGRDWNSDWRDTPLYSTKSTYFYPWNEMIVPAGLLQFPIYSAINPTMYRVQTFGATAVRLASAFILAINEQGSWFSKFGDYPDDWWSNSTYYNYLSLKKCYSDIYAKVQTKPLPSDGEPEPIQLIDPDYYAETAVANIGALRNAFVAYKSEPVQSDPRTQHEPLIPGVPAKARDEYFFLAYAQSSCAVRTDDRTAINMVWMNWLPEELAVNTALSQLKEFSDVFRCPPGSPMNPIHKCDTIF